MTVREYARSLADQNLSQTEMYDKIRAYSNSLKSKEEVKKKDSQTADPSSESSDNTGSESASGSSAQYEIPEKYTKVAQPGSTHKPGDGYEYKYEINKEGKGEYYTKKEGKDDWIQASGVSEIAVAGEFGHADFDKEKYFAQQNKNKKQNEEAKDLDKKIAEQPDLTTVKETEVAYTNVADTWKTREGKKASDASGRVYDEEKGETVKVKDKAERAALTLEDFDGDQKQFDSYSKWKELDDKILYGGRKFEPITENWSHGKQAYNDFIKLKNAKKPDGMSYNDWRGMSSGDHMGERKDSEGNWVPSVRKKLSLEFDKKYPNIDYRTVKKRGQGYVTEAYTKEGLKSDEIESLRQEQKKYESSLDEGQFVIGEESDFSKFFTGENRVQLVKATELVPNPEAVNDFNTKYILPDENGNSSDGINFSELTSKAQSDWVQENGEKAWDDLGDLEKEKIKSAPLTVKLDAAIQEAVSADPQIQKIELQTRDKLAPLVSKKQQELLKKHDVNTPEGNNAFNKELEDYYEKIYIKEIKSNEAYGNRVKEIGAVGNKAFQVADNSFDRSNSWLATLDKGSNLFNGVPILDFATETFADSIEGFAKGSKGIGSGFDKAMVSYDTQQAKTARDNIKALQKAKAEGKIKDGQLFSHYGKKITYDEKIKKLEQQEESWTEALEQNLDEIKVSDLETLKYQTANFDDGFDWSDVVLTTAEALPQIGLAAAGTFASAVVPPLAPVLGALGTITMGVTMYGDAYMDAAETGAQVDYDAENGSGAWDNLTEEDQRDYLVDGLKDGRYHEPGKAALISAVQTGMEKIGAGKILAKTQKALGVGKNGLASIIAGDFKQAAKSITAGALSKAEAAGTEFVTEWGQEIVGGIGKGMMVDGGGGPYRYVDGKAALEAGRAGGIVGFMLPFAGSVKSQSAIEIRALSRKVAINFAPSSEFGTAAQINADFFKNAQKELDKRLTTGKNPDGTEYTKEQHQEDSINIANIKNASDKIPKGMDQQTREKMLDLMIKRDNLNRKIKDIGDKDLSVEEESELNETKEQLQDIMKQEALFKTSGNVRTAIRKSGKGNVDFQDFSNAEDMNKYAKEQKLKGWQEKNSANHGVVLYDKKTGKERILINNELSLEDGNVNVGAHEFLHTVLRNTVQNSKGTAIALGKSLGSYLEGIDSSQVDVNSDYGKRLAAYKNDPANIKGEEAITLFSDAIANGSIKFNENVFTKIGDAFRRTLQAAGIKNVRFNTGRDVYNFVKDYNKSIEKGEGLNKAQQALLDGRAEGDLVKREYKTKDSTADTKVSRKLTPEQDQQAQTKVKEIQELQKESEALAKKYKKYKKDSEGNVLKDKQGNPVLDVIKGAKQQRLETELAADIKPTVDSFVESRTKALYDPIPADAKKGVTRQEFVQSMKSDISTMINNEFKAKQPLEKFITSRGFVRANSLAKRLGIKSVEQGIDQSIDTASNITNETDGDVKTETETRTTQSPRATTQFTPDFVANLDVNAEGKTEAEVNEEIQKQFDGAIAKDLEAMGPVTTFGQTKDIGPALAALMEKATQGRTEKVVNGEKKIVKTPGIPAKVFMEKSKNIAKKYAVSGALTAVKQYLDANAQRDFNNLPDAFAPNSGKATFIPENVKKALYKKNDKDQFVLDKSKTLADYKALLGDMEKPVYRASEATTIKGLIALSLRNRMFEQAVPDAVERSVTGVKFSKQAEQDFDYEEALKTKVKVDSKEGKQQLEGIANARTKKAVNDLLNLPNLTITAENRAALQAELLEIIESDPNFDLDVFEAGVLQNSGAIRTRLKNGNVVYELTNGKTIPGVYTSTSSKTGKKNFKPPTPAQIEKKFGTGVTLVADRNRLYYGKTDPAYIAAKDAANANTQKSKIKAKRVRAKNARTKEAAKQAKDNLSVLESVALKLEAMVEANPASIKFASMIIEGSYQATTGLTKIAGQINSASVDPQFASVGKSNQIGGKEKYREEHSPPASVVGGSLIWAIKNGQVKEVMKGVRANYFQTLLSKADDVKLDRAGLDSTLPPGVSIMTPNAGIRRFAAAGINLNTIKDFKTGKDFAEIMNVGVETKESKRNPNIVYAQNSLINEQIKGDLEVDVTMDKAAIKKFDPHGIIEVVSNRLFGEANYFKLNDTQKAAVQKEMITKNIAKLTQARIKAYEPIASLELKASKRNTKTYGGKVNPEMTIAEQLTVLSTYDQAARKARSLDTPKKGISVFDFDDTLAKTKEKVIVNKLDGTSTEISAAQFAAQALQLESEGSTFDFSNFENVSKGTAKGPLADLALRRQDKFGSKDIFVLTARPQASAQAIKTFLDGIGLNLPIENITGLADGSPAAKGNWVAGKAAKGYNDFYFADDAYKNVEAVQEVLSQVDVDSEVQIAKFSKRKVFDQVFNDIIESSTGIETYKEYSRAKAQTVGKKKGRFNFFTTPSAEDFLGLLYKTLGKGKKGDAQLDFYKKNLIDTYNRAEMAVTKAKIQAANDFKALKRNLKTLPKSLSKEVGYGGFTFSQAVRVAAWSRQGLTIPGLSKTDLKALNTIIDNDAELNTFVDELIKIQKGKPYPAPSKDWLGGNITSDILNDINKVNRKEYLQEWQENVDIIFSEKNMNKLEAAYGPKYVEALRDTLRRMKSGSNRPLGGSRVVNQLLDWLNNSVGAIMFLNTRSAVLQTLSAVNFIGVGNNSLLNSAKAFLNQKQYWKDFQTLMNSPYLVERRNGLKINVSESEIADAVADSSNKAKSVLGLLLNKGFVLTRFADSFAIATGGAAFYRNQLDMYLNQGMDQKLAEQKAFEDFYQIAEVNQQSSNPSKISQQQASGAGRVILAFANTPMQYARIIKRSTQDLINGRGDWKKHVGTIAFYGVAQNLIFNALQNALFSEAFGEDEEDEEKEDKTGRIANGMADSLLSGLGIQGKAALALKNSLITLAQENNKKSPKFVKAVYDLFDFSPPLDSKFRKLRSAANTFTWERELMKEKGFSLDNPAYLAGAQVISGLTNLPLDRAISKLNNIRGIMSEQSEKWQKVALALGWSTWDVGLGYYGGFDPVKPLTPEQQYDLDVSNMKKDTTSAQQKQTLLDLGLTRAEIKKLKYEEDRVKKIIALQKKKKDARSKK
jgi:hypothetical protein